jgi:phage baseplate assembly protein W
VEPEETSIARQRVGKQISAATDMEASIEELLGTMICIRSMQSGYKKNSVENSRDPEFQVSS